MQLDLLDEAPPEVAVQQADALDSPPVSSMQDLAEDTEQKEKAPGAFRTISEVASYLDVPQYVLRFWESRFSQIKPVKMRGGRRYYRPEDVQTLTTIKNLLYKQGYTIKGAKKAFGKGGAVSVAREEPPVLAAKPALPEKEHSQLAVIRQELISLRDMLKPHVF